MAALLELVPEMVVEMEETVPMEPMVDQAWLVVWTMVNWCWEMPAVLVAFNFHLHSMVPVE